uniref:Putative calmodulin-related protein n=1 Tax=Medicago sativa TaxID=3879 RepID=Q9AR93_MEDSA|nr:putative calmodulin-related protein [Medicago sativa]
MKKKFARIFNKFDKNGDGKISRTELKEMMTALGCKTTTEEVTRMMEELDRNGDGYIDLKEFGELHNGGGDTKELREAFEMYDLGKNGLTSAKELHAVMRRLGEKCSLGDCRRMIGNVDADSDGNVNFEEFKKMMSRSEYCNDVMVKMYFTILFYYSSLSISILIYIS